MSVCVCVFCVSVKSLRQQLEQEVMGKKQGDMHGCSVIRFTVSSWWLRFDSPVNLKSIAYEELKGCRRYRRTLQSSVYETKTHTTWRYLAAAKIMNTFIIFGCSAAGRRQGVWKG